MNDNETEQNVPISCLIDWKKCLFCQDNSGTLQCPALSKRKDNGAGYRTLIEDLCEFEKLGQLPLQFSLERLGDGAGAVETLCTNTACWHKSCRDQYNKTKLQRAKKRKCSEGGEDNNAKNGKKTTRLSIGNMPGMSTKEDLCFFCEEKASTEVLRSASTFGLDSRVRSAALLLEEEKLLTKLNSGDLIAVEAKYHKKCLTSLYNHARDKRRRQNRHCDDLNMAHSIALAELISYLEDSRVKGEVKVHKLSSLVIDYSVRSTQLRADSDQQVHATRLKNRLTTHIPELRAISNGREVLLSFDEEIGDLLSDNLFQDHDSDAMCLMRAVNIVRRDILDHKYCFQGSFEPDCQSKSIPESLNALVRMILEGSSIKNQASGRGSSQAALTIAQLIKFNCVKSRRQNSSFLTHQNSMETPLPLYIGAMIHTRTRKKGLVDRLFDLGISVSYDRVLNVSADLGNLLSNQFEATGIVCPASLRKNVFTTMAVDNIDHNPSSATAADSFHGTAISVVQHPSTVGEGTELEKPAFVSTASKSIKPLPSFYTNVSPVAKSCVQSPTGMLQGSMAFDSNTMSVAIRNEYAWLEQLHFAFKEEEVTNSSDEMLLETRMKPWPVFHSQRKAVQVKPKSASYLLPMFPDCAHSVPMIKHSMKVAVKLTDHANPGTKSDLIQCLMEEIDTEDVSPKPTCVILDGTVLVQMLRPKNCKTFKDYSTSMFLPHLKSWLQKAQRVDLVWDNYCECSLNASSRESRGRGQRRRVLSSAPLPTDWQAFLRLDENKKELFAFLSIEAGSLETEGTELVFTLKEGVVCYPARETLMLAPCSHEEADTRMMVHVADAAASGYSSIPIRTVDTDVVALAVAVFGEVEVSELWIMFGTGKNQRMLPIHEIAKKLGQEKSQSLPLFHALTGCDTTSFFLGHGKKRAWTTWENLPDLTKTLLNIQKLEGTSEVPDQCIQVIERFIVLLYDRTSMLSKV